MSKFLSPEWLAAIRTALNESDQVTEFAQWAYLTFEHVCVDMPGGGEARHWRRFADGKVDVELGPAPQADATMTTSYEDAVAINKGELDLLTAFTRGKLQIAGDMTRLVQYQAELEEIASTVHSVPAEY